MPFCGEASTWAKVALTLSIIALGIHCTGYGTNYWMARYTVRDKLNVGIGLWRMTNCSGYYNAPCFDFDFPSSLKENYVKVTQAMESCSLILLFVTMVCLLFYVAAPKSRTRGMAISILVLAFVSAAFSITGMLVWVENIPQYYYPNWSFGLTVFSATLIITTGILLIPDIREYDYKDLLKVGGEFQNLAVTSYDDHPPPPAPVEMYKDDMTPTVVPQNPMAAPTYNFLQYDRNRKMDGF